MTEDFTPLTLDGKELESETPDWWDFILLELATEYGIPADFLFEKPRGDEPKRGVSPYATAVAEFAKQRELCSVIAERFEIASINAQNDVATVVRAFIDILADMLGKLLGVESLKSDQGAIVDFSVTRTVRKACSVEYRNGTSEVIYYPFNEMIRQAIFIEMPGHHGPHIRIHVRLEHGVQELSVDVPVLTRLGTVGSIVFDIFTKIAQTINQHGIWPPKASRPR